MVVVEMEDAELIWLRPSELRESHDFFLDVRFFVGTNPRLPIGLVSHVAHRAAAAGSGREGKKTTSNERHGEEEEEEGEDT